MTISIWRYSHLTLAISSALFITIAALTGIILAFEPISDKLNPYASEALQTVSITETIGVLVGKYEEVVQIDVDKNDFVSATVITKEGESNTFYIHPKTGEKVGEITEKLALFKFSTNLHRSLFLKSTGRCIIGFVSFLLFLIATTGMLLIAKSQGGIRKVFTKVVKENFHQYYHIILGRIFLIPLIIIALTGVYLSLEKLSLVTQNKNKSQSLKINENALNIKVIDFEFFKTTKLKDIKKIEFPFSKDAQDYFYVKTIQNEYQIHQFNGQIISQKKQGFNNLGVYYSLILHTGKGTIIWSIVLLLSCFAILYFIFSGFSMFIKRMKTTTKIINKTTRDEAEFIVLVGSETGTTIRFATAFKNALSKANKKVFIGELNDYTTYNKAKNLIVFTATYGAGEAPANASKFLKLLKTVQQKNDLKYTVLGFGSTNYPAFCKFAILVHASLQIQPKFVPEMPLIKIDNQDFNCFESWKNKWCSLNNLQLEIDENDVSEKEAATILNVTHRSEVNVDDTFLISLKPNKKVQFTSGDLLSITPQGETRKRQYSIAKIGDEIVLSVKKNDFGVCANYLATLHEKDRILGRIQPNEKFHFPEKAKDVILIANGTGIAPFLGMIQENKKVRIHLFWGGRTTKSLALYTKYIEAALENKTLSSFQTAYSQEQKKYVQELLENQTTLIANLLKKDGVMLICGSLNMQFAVEKVLGIIASQELNTSIEVLKEKKQIRTDCY
jgi:sulfite reductase (NADPH) flavoprotein alpha-component